MISIHYNGVIFKDCLIRRFEQSIVRDESGTDRMYSRYLISVEATLVERASSDEGLGLNPGNMISIPRASAGSTTTVEREIELQSLLAQDRKDFYLMVGGQEDAGAAVDYEKTLLLAAGYLIDGGGNINVHPTDPGQGTTTRRNVIDVENGPHCQDTTIDQVFGGRVMRVTTTFKICRLLCRSDDYFPTPPVNDPNIRTTNDEVLSNRWSLTESKDENWKTTRQIQGTLRTKSSYFFAQNYRFVCMPPLLRGYRRVDQRFVSDPTDTVLKYSITDRQEHAAPPPPAVKWTATHTEATTQMGARQVAHMRVVLTGPPGVDKRHLIGACGRVITSRLVDLEKVPGSTYETLLENLNIVDRIDQPVIEMNVSARYTSSQYRWLSMRVLNMTVPLEESLGIDGYNPLSNPVPLAYDSVNPAGIFSCYLQDPCSPWHWMGGAVSQSTASNERPYRKEADRPDAYEYPEPRNLDRDQDNLYKDPESLYDILKYPYTLYTIANHYESGMGKLHLPLAADDQATETALVVNVHKGITRRILEIEAVRDGMPPLVPKILDKLQDANGNVEHLLESDITTRAPELLGDSFSKRYGIAMRLVYGLSKRISNTGILEVGSLPFDASTPADNRFNIDSQDDDKGTLMNITAPAAQAAGNLETLAPAASRIEGPQSQPQRLSQPAKQQTEEQQP